MSSSHNKKFESNSEVMDSESDKQDCADDHSNAISVDDDDEDGSSFFDDSDDDEDTDGQVVPEVPSVCFSSDYI